MASMPFAQFSLLPRICRWDLKGNPFPCKNLEQIGDFRVSKKLLMAVSGTESFPEEVSNGEAGNVVKKNRRTSKRAPARPKKQVVESPAEDSAASSAVDEGILAASVSTDNSKKTRTKTRKKAPTTPVALVEEPAQKITRQRRPRKNANVTASQDNEEEINDIAGDMFPLVLDEDSEVDLELDIGDEEEDISFTYGWPPLVCCFGAAQHAFVPNGRRANRLIDYEFHDRNRDALWEPERFVRSSGGSASNVAIALAKLGGKVAFMGKLGDDDYGQSLLYFLNSNKVQTRSIRVDNRKTTGASRMKIGKKAGLRMTSAKPCAEDCLSSSEINIDVLKEGKMFYFNSFSLLDRSMRSTTFEAVKIAKKLGNIIFYDPNIPLPLWKSSEETTMFIQRAWQLSDIIEVTKQEFEFLSGLSPSEKFDTRDNDSYKFPHYSPEVVSKLWHDDLRVLFVTNGTSKIHYYTKEHHGFAHGMEDAPLTPYTAHMSASGDGIVAGIMRMLTVQPHLITHQGYLEKTIRYAITCGVTDQWLEAISLGYPAKEGMDDVEADPHGIRSITEREYRTVVASGSS